MSRFISDAWEFLTGQPDHPVYRHEVEGWSYVRFWRGLRRGCLPLVVLVMLGGSLCCGLTALLNLTFPLELPGDGWVLALTMLTGLLVGGEIIRWLTGLLATVLTATTISAEIEAQTFGLLRLTPIPVRQIVLAKLGAAFRQFRLPLAAVALARAAFVLGAVPLAAAALARDGVFGPAPALDSGLLAGLPAGQVALLVVAGVAVAIALLVWFVYFLLAPILSTFMFAALGMLASAHSRTRAGGVTLAAGVRVGLWGLGYVLGQLGTLSISLLVVPLAALPPTLLWVGRLTSAHPANLVLGGALLAITWALILAAGQIGAALVVLHMTVRRAENLPRP